MTARTRWVVVGGGFLANVFDAMEIILLSLALPAIRENLHLTAAQGQPTGVELRRNHSYAAGRRPSVVIGLRRDARQEHR
jgi:hypothetical protein